MSLPIIAQWRTELEGELAEARAELDIANDEMIEARAVAAAAKVEKSALDELISRLGQRTQLASALLMRYRHRATELSTDGDGAVLRARQAISSAMARIADLQSALAQLDELSPPPEPVRDLEEAA